jgi:hypothetical protein
LRESRCGYRLGANRADNDFSLIGSLRVLEWRRR